MVSTGITLPSLERIELRQCPRQTLKVGLAHDRVDEAVPTVVEGP